MRKQINMNNRVDKKKLYNSIMESVIPEIRKAIKESEETQDTDDEQVDEAALNELFGFGSSAKKPSKALSLENTDEENADLFIEWFNYFMVEAGNNVKKGLAAFLKMFGAIIAKSPMFVVKGILRLLSGAVKGSVFTVATVASVVLGSIALLVKLVKTGVEKASDALSQLYKMIKSGITQFYNKFKADAGKMSTDAKDKVTIWMGTISAATSACATGMQGAAEAVGEFIVGILKDAKEGVEGAVLIAKTWLQSKSEDVKKWITDKAGDIRKAVVNKWNELDKAVRKAYNAIAEKIESWMSDLGELITFIGDKIADAANSAKDFAIGQKDKALVWGIQKAVKGLSDKYTEDQVVALVRKCYNESLVPVNGKFVINEAYFYGANDRRRKLYESRMNRGAKRV